jgi:integrase
MPGYHRGRAPRNKGEQYPADPPTIEEIIEVMCAIGERSDGFRLRALIVLLWRAGLRISEALALGESDLDRGRGAVLVRCGKGDKRREVGMDRWAWDWEASAARKQLHHAAAQAGIRRRFAPHQPRSRKLGKYELPARFFGISNSISPTLVSHARGRCPFRCVSRVSGATSPSPAPTSALISASISSRATIATASLTKSSSRPSRTCATTSATVVML